MIIYRITDDEFELLAGENQLSDFAVTQVCNCPDDFLMENLEGVYEQAQEIAQLAERVLSSRQKVTVDEAKTILNVRCFDIEEVTIY